jgi:hypothetical protein
VVEKENDYYRMREKAIKEDRYSKSEVSAAEQE